MSSAACYIPCDNVNDEVVGILQNLNWTESVRRVRSFVLFQLDWCDERTAAIRIDETKGQLLLNLYLGLPSF